jgi:trimeric autotransporter adhesin
VESTTSLALQGEQVPQNLAFTYDISGGNASYNGLIARLSRRMRNGFTYTIVYTYSKSIDDSSSIGGSSQTVVQEYPLFNLERGLSTFDMRHQITGNATYELPFGERKHWIHTGMPARIFGNWRLSGSETFHTGMPLTPTVSSVLTGYTSSNFVTRPDVMAGCNPNIPFVDQSIQKSSSGGLAGYGFFNTNCYQVPGSDFPGTSLVAPGSVFGDAGRDSIEGPWDFVVNLALQKTITLDRDNTKHLDIRWEVNNVGNHPNWTTIGLNVGTSNFGDVLGAGAMRTMDCVIRLNF